MCAENYFNKMNRSVGNIDSSPKVGWCAQENGSGGRGPSEMTENPGSVPFAGDNLSELLRRVKNEASPLYLQAGANPIPSFTTLVLSILLHWCCDPPGRLIGLFPALHAPLELAFAELQH